MLPSTVFVFLRYAIIIIYTCMYTVDLVFGGKPMINY